MLLQVAYGKQNSVQQALLALGLLVSTLKNFERYCSEIRLAYQPYDVVNAAHVAQRAEVCGGSVSSYNIIYCTTDPCCCAQYPTTQTNAFMEC